jgi:hypothetical protein
MQSHQPVIASMDGGTYDLSGDKVMTFNPEHKKVWSKPYSLNVNF